MTPIEDLEDRLAKLDESFKAASSEGGFGNQLPEPGVYQTLFREVDFFEAKADGRAFVKLVFEVAHDPQYRGWPIEIIHPLEPEGAADFVEMKLGFLKRDLKTLGVDVDADDFTFAQVRPGSAIWDPHLDAQYEIAVKDSKKLNPNTNQPYRNAFLNARLGDPLPKAVQTQMGSDVPAAAEDVQPPAMVPEDEALPF